MPKVKCITGFRGNKPGTVIEVTAQEAKDEAALGARARFAPEEPAKKAPKKKAEEAEG